MTRIAFMLIFAHVCVQSGDSANILAMLPIPAKSHHAVFRPLLIELANKGHNVTYVTPLPLKKPPSNMTQIKVDNVLKKVKHMMESENKKESWINAGLKWLINNWMNLLLREVGIRATELILQEPEMKDIMEDTKVKYDLIILEMTFAQEALSALSHKYKAPIVEIMPTSNFHWSYLLYGNPYDTNYIVEVDTSFSDRMTFRERLVNTVISMANRFLNMYSYMPRAEALANRYIRYRGWESRPPLLDIVKNTSLVLVNTHVAVNYPYPLSPNVKEIGGINLQAKPKPLPKEMQDFMDEAQDGIIYLSMGSSIAVSTELGERFINEFLKVFSRIKQRVLWRWQTEIQKVPPNVRVEKRFPQQDILAHKNIKLFISHGGLLSVTESTYHGVPIIGIPIVGDQHKNVGHIKATGYGIHLDVNNITEASISWAIDEVLSNPRYNRIVKERSTILKERNQSSLKEATYWIEYVLRHDGAHHLRPAVSELTWYQQALLDVYITLAVLIIISLIIIYSVVRGICSLLHTFFASRRSGKKSKRKKK